MDARRTDSRTGPVAGAATCAALLCAALLLTIIPATAALASNAALSEGSARPNIVVIVTDDQRWDEMAGLPTIDGQLVDKGVTFTNGYVVNSLCCPSRTSILTGDYSHTTGVYRQAPPFGGWESFNDTSTLATWLQDSGYDTGLVGKYIDAYQHAALTGYIPPGWDTFVGFIHSQYQDYSLTWNGTIRRYGEETSQYATDVLGGEAQRFVRDAKGPLFLYFTPPAPHAPATPPERYAHTPAPAAPEKPPSFNEADVSDKPAWVRALPRLSASAQAAQALFRTDQYRSMLAVDDAVAGIIKALRDTGRLANTMFVFTSDNGLMEGEHRWTKKEAAYDESVHVPFVVRYDPVTQGLRATDDRFALNIDIAPTVAAVAGVTTPAVDGKSLLPLLREDAGSGPDPPWRTDFLIEHLRETNPVPTFCATRSETSLYVAYETGEQELYDLRTDPYELRNVAADPQYARLLDERRHRLEQLCTPTPPGFAFVDTARRTIAGVAAFSLLLALAAVLGRRRARAARV